MISSLELALILLGVSGSLVLGQLSRDFNCRIFQEKIFGLLLGLTIGIIQRIFDTSFLSWFPEVLPVLLTLSILEKVHTMPRVIFIQALVFNRLGSIILMTTIGGSLATCLGTLLLSLILSNLNHNSEISSIIQLICTFLVPGSSLGIEKDSEYHLFMNSHLFSLLFTYPLHASIQFGYFLYFELWAVGLVIGIVVGIIGSLLIRAFKLSKSWTPFEVLTPGLLSVVSALASQSIGGSPVVSMIVSCLLLVKYGLVSDGSLVSRSTFYQTTSLVAEVLVQIWIGLNLVQVNLDYQVASLLVFMVIVLIFSYLLALALAYLCKVKSVKVVDCISFTFGGFRGTSNAFLIQVLPKELKDVAFLGCVVYSVLGTGLSYFLTSGKEESSYLISSNPCSKVKMIVQNFEETYLIPIFLKETVEKSILSPKFNENSQRFDAGIQMRPEIRDETSRELQALNLNITESEVQGPLQLK
jgi:hypothetical protein